MAEGHNLLLTTGFLSSVLVGLLTTLHIVLLSNVLLGGVLLDSLLLGGELLSGHINSTGGGITIIHADNGSRLHSHRGTLVMAVIRIVLVSVVLILEIGSIPERVRRRTLVVATHITSMVRRGGLIVVLAVWLVMITRRQSVVRAHILSWLVCLAGTDILGLAWAYVRSLTRTNILALSISFGVGERASVITMTGVGEYTTLVICRRRIEDSLLREIRGAVFRLWGQRLGRSLLDIVTTGRIGGTRLNTSKTSGGGRHSFSIAIVDIGILATADREIL